MQICFDLGGSEKQSGWVRGVGGWRRMARSDIIILEIRSEGEREREKERERERKRVSERERERERKRGPIKSLHIFKANSEEDCEIRYIIVKSL